MSPLVLTLVLAVSRAAGHPDAGVPAPPPAPPSEPVVYGGAELSALALPSGAPHGGEDGFLALHPVLGVQAGAWLRLELGPTLRLRLLDTPPANAPSDLPAGLRREDWDARSDLGQVLESLTLGDPSWPLQLKAGALRHATLGAGHLVARYDNRQSPDSHPAGATLDGELGPARLTLLASDVLAARLFAGEVALDVGALTSPSREVRDRYVVALSVAHDAARGEFPAGGARPFTREQQVTLGHLDGSAVLLRNASVRLQALAGAGLRSPVSGTSSPGWGALVGVAADGLMRDVALSARLEGRLHQGGFVQGYFGPRYELARYSAWGLAGAPLAQTGAPTPASASLEVRAAKGLLGSAHAQVECFAADTWVVDAGVTLALLDERLAVSARLSQWLAPVGSRTHAEVDARWRLAPSVYVLGTGGTVFFPQGSGALARGWTASLGVGVDFAR